MVDKGFSLVRSFQYVLIMTLAQLPGYFTAAYFIEKFGRKFVLVTYLVLTAFSAIWFGYANTEGSAPRRHFPVILQSGSMGRFICLQSGTLSDEGSFNGVGLATSFGRIGGVIAPRSWVC